MLTIFVSPVSAETIEEEAQRCFKTCRPLETAITPKKESRRVVHNCLTGCRVQAQNKDSFMICPDNIGYPLSDPASDCSTNWKAAVAARKSKKN
jgi:hypothetical protein